MTENTDSPRFRRRVRGVSRTGNATDAVRDRVTRRASPGSSLGFLKFLENSSMFELYFEMNSAMEKERRFWGSSDSSPLWLKVNCDSKLILVFDRISLDVAA